MKLRIALIILSLPAIPATAATIYSESVSGDLSDQIESPSSLGTLLAGDNTVTGIINEGNLPFDLDAFTFSVAPGQVLSSLRFTLTTADDNHFLGLSDDTALVADASSLLFATLVAGSQNGQNILPSNADGGSFAGIGYTLPLSAGDYSLWFQETTFIDPIGFQEVGYAFTLTTEAIPEPSMALLLTLSPLIFWIRSRPT